MEQHPIPQDITGFKFKLVGDMTIRQFGYLASGLVLGWIIYSTPWYPIVRLPIAALLAFAGVAFAFIPIEDRPLDIWVVNFFKAIYKPTFLVWQKAGNGEAIDSPLLSTTGAGQASFNFPGLWPLPKINLGVPKKKAPVNETVAEKTEQLMPIPANSNIQTPTPTNNVQTTNTSSAAQPIEPVVKPLSIDELEKMRAEKLAEISRDSSKTAGLGVSANVTLTPQSSEKIDIVALEKIRKTALTPKDPETEKTITKYDEQLKELTADNARIAGSIEEMKQQITALGGQDTTVLVKNLAELEDSKNQISAKITELQETLNHLRQTPISEEPLVPKPLTPVRIVPHFDRPTQTISLSAMPNVISGLIKDEKNIPVASVIVLIKDQAASPIRALKTNKIGQFITNTPLENGTYYLEMEREDWTFDTLEIKLTGQVVPLIEITGKQNGHS